MKWQPFMAAIPALVALAPAYAAQYLDVQQAQQVFFPGQQLERVPLNLDAATRGAMRKASGVHERFDADRVWKAADGGFFIVDDVVGRHELITYAVALDAQGTVKGIEILAYHETYGYQVREAGWRHQFQGLSSHNPPKLGGNIRNITGATLSCKHVTQGVQRVLALYRLKLARA